MGLQCIVGSYLEALAHDRGTPVGDATNMASGHNNFARELQSWDERLDTYVWERRVTLLKVVRLQIQGYLAHNPPPPSYHPTAGLCLGPYGGPRGGTFSHERGTPVGS